MTCHETKTDKIVEAVLKKMADNKFFINKGVNSPEKIIQLIKSHDLSAISIFWYTVHEDPANKQYQKIEYNACCNTFSLYPKLLVN